MCSFFFCSVAFTQFLKRIAISQNKKNSKNLGTPEKQHGAYNLWFRNGGRGSVERRYHLGYAPIGQNKCINYNGLHMHQNLPSYNLYFFLFWHGLKLHKWESSEYLRYPFKNRGIIENSFMQLIWWEACHSDLTWTWLSWGNGCWGHGRGELGCTEAVGDVGTAEWGSTPGDFWQH